MPHEEKTFSLTEARGLLPWVREASSAARKEISQVQQEEKDPQAARQRLQGIIQHWAETVWKLGASPKQPFTVDFDSGSDYYCWQYPEDDIYFRHDYETGYAGRRPIEEDS